MTAPEQSDAMQDNTAPGFPGETEMHARINTRDRVQTPLGARDRQATVERLRHTEAALRESEAKLREVRNARDDFLAMLGHELRNPLQPIRTALQLMHLRDPTVFERERTMIESQVHHMVGMVDDLLDVSRIARGKVTLARAPVRIADVVAHSLETAEPLLVDRRQTIDKQIADDVVIEGDERRLTQILTNLLTNAAKYSPPGRTIHLTARSADDNAVIRVRDEGFGIDKVLLPRIFDTFTQDARSVARSRGGLGLGLAIVRNLVGMHGGSVEARSEGRDRGSEFIVRLPLARDTANPTPDNTIEENTKRADEVQPAIKVLIVDDYAAAADSLAELLELSGLRTRIARDGPAAIEAAAEFHPGIALIDIGLPVMNGYEVARRLREIPEIGHPHLVAVTGYGQERDRKLAKEAGFDEHLAKPIDAERIDSLIRDHAANTGTERWP